MAALATAACTHHDPHDEGPRKVLVASDRDGDWALYAVDPATGASQRIMHSDAGYSGSRALPSPDGREVLMPEGGGSSAFVVGVDGRGSRRLRTSYWQEAAWSPDTKRIALDGQPGIAVVRRDGTHRTMVTDAEGNQPAWSPDGKRIAYSGSNGLEIVDADGGTPKRFPTGYLADQAAWSPDGREVAFVGAESNRGRLLAVDVDSGRIRELARGARGPISWSPDGARLLYLRNSRPGAVFVVDADGSSSRRIAVADRGAYLLDARWSPDGKRIILSSGGAHRPGESELVEVRSMRPDGSGMRRLTRAYGPDGGNNVILGWVRGDLRKEPRPRPRAAEHVLRVPYEVGVVSAEGGRVAVAPVALYGDVSPLPPTGPLLVWAPASGRIRRFVAAGCGRVDELTLGARRVVFSCETSEVDFADSAVRVFGLAAPRPVQLFYGVDSFYVDPKGSNVLGGLAGDAGTTAFTTQRTLGHGLNPRLAAKRLWRVDGVHRSAIASGRTLGDPVAVERGRILLQGGAHWAEVVDAQGRVVVRLPIRGPRRTRFDGMTPSLALTGNRVAFLDKRRLRVYDARSGLPLAAWPVPPGPNRLAGAAEGLVAYVHGRTVYVVRLADGRETIVRVAAARRRPAQRELVHGDLSAAGLFYSYNATDKRYPGRVVFVPRARFRV